MENKLDKLLGALECARESLMDGNLSDAESWLWAVLEHTEPKTQLGANLRHAIESHCVRSLDELGETLFPEIHEMDVALHTYGAEKRAE